LYDKEMYAIKKIIFSFVELGISIFISF
jgi:hypothetical protein